MCLNYENELIEYKKSTSEINEAIVDLSAMLNKHCQGTIYFGVKNNGEVCGMDISDSTLRDVSRKIYEQIKPQIYPTVELLTINNKFVVKVRALGNQRPYSSFGRYYKRVADESREITPLELAEMIMSVNYNNWENQTSDVTIDNVDEEQLRLFHLNSIKSGRMPNIVYNKLELLSKLGLVSKDGYHLNNAGKLLFSDVGPIGIKMAVFASDEKETFIDITTLKGNVFNLINVAEKYIKEHMNWEAKIEGLERNEIPEIPIEALREIIINSFAHANYISNSKHEVDIHPGKIAIYNPGNFPDGYIPEDFVNKQLSSKVRNELICDVLFKCNIVETWGTGLRKTYKICKENSISIYYEKENDGFWFFFDRNKNNMNKNIVLSELEKVVLNEIEKKPNITRAELTKSTSRNLRSIQRILENLKEKNIIERVGSNKTGYWKVKI